MMLFRYGLPLGLLSAVLYVSLYSSDNRPQNLRKLSTPAAGYMDPRSLQLKMGQMQTQTTQGLYAHHPAQSNLSSQQQQQQQNQQQQQQHQYKQIQKPYATSDSRGIEVNNYSAPDAHQALNTVSQQQQAPLQPRVVDQVQSQQQQQQQQEALQTQQPQEALQTQPPAQKLLYSRNKNILTLGGSTTWGSKLEARESAYPYILPQNLGPTWRVYNLAVRATDASYASQCIESMIREGAKNKKNIEFDVILLEYSLNGLDGMPLLLSRLRQRFPNAVIMYIHLWSLRMTVDNAVTGAKPREEINRGLTFKEADANINNMLGDTSAKWDWAPKMKQDSEAIANEARQHMKEVGGHIYQVPMPESPQVAFDEHWFGPDYHHLSSQGHAMVANHLVKLLRNESIMSNHQQPDINDISLAPDESGIGSWGAGDQCYSWYETGTHPDIQVDGGTVKNFVKNDKWAVNVGLTFGQPANIWFPNRKPEAQPVMLMIMSWGPGVYPKAKIELRSPGFADQSSVLDPLHPDPLNHLFHVTRTAHVGWANFGQSQITVDPIEDMQRPLRVIGIVMCGACLEMNDNYLTNDSTHQRLGGTLPRPSEIRQSKDAQQNQLSRKDENQQAVLAHNPNDQQLLAQHELKSADDQQQRTQSGEKELRAPIMQSGQNLQQRPSASGAHQQYLQQPLKTTGDQIQQTPKYTDMTGPKSSGAQPAQGFSEQQQSLQSQSRNDGQQRPVEAQPGSTEQLLPKKKSTGYGAQQQQAYSNIGEQRPLSPGTAGQETHTSSMQQQPELSAAQTM